MSYAIWNNTSNLARVVSTEHWCTFSAFHLFLVTCLSSHHSLLQLSPSLLQESLSCPLLCSSSRSTLILCLRRHLEVSES